MLNQYELIERGFIPKTGGGRGKPYPPGFRLPLSVDHKSWQQLPLHIQIMYAYHLTVGVDHALNKQLEL